MRAAKIRILVGVVHEGGEGGRGEEGCITIGGERERGGRKDVKARGDEFPGGEEGLKWYGRKERGWTEEYADEGSNRGVRKGVNGRGIEKRAGGSVRDVGRTRERKGDEGLC